MANAFNLTAQINLRGPGSGAIRPIVADIKRQLGTIKANVDLKIDTKASKSISNITNRLTAMNNVLNQARTNAEALSVTFQNLSNTLTSIRQSSAAVSTGVKNLNASTAASAKNMAQASSAMAEFGKQSGLAIKRFAAYSVVTSGVYGLVNAVTSGFDAFIKFDKELVRLQQVTGKSATGLRDLENQITRLSIGLGVSSESLIGIASTLAQAGLSAEETRIAIEALAKTELAPSFDNLADTTEGAIAAMRQFGIEAKDLESALGSINAVAAAFAVESSDIIAAIQRTGGVFASSSKGVSEGTAALNEFIAVFTSVRATTRESAETIATGLRTIFTRIQRAKTIDQLQEFGVQLTDLEGKFVGPYEAVKRLSIALNQLDPRDIRFSQIVEELGGFRQIGKVIPLIQQFSEAQKALAVAQKGTGSLAEAQAIAQLSLANRIAKVREQFLALIRDIGKSDAFQALAKGVLSLTSGLLTLVSAFKPVLPILAVIGAIKGFKAATEFGGGFIGAFKKGGGARGAGEGIGSAITGGDRDKTAATALAAEAIRLNTDALKSLTSAVHSLDATIKNRGSTTLASGGRVLGFNSGGIVPGSGKGDKVPALLEPGEVVINNKAASKYGRANLAKINKYVSGGKIKKRLSEIGLSLNQEVSGIDLAQTDIKLKKIKLSPNDFAEMQNIIMQTKEETSSIIQKYPGEETEKFAKKYRGGQWLLGKAFQTILEKKYRLNAVRPATYGTPKESFDDIIEEHFEPLDFETGDAKFVKDLNSITNEDVLRKRLRYEFKQNRLKPKPSTKIESFDLPDTSVYYPETGIKERFDSYIKTLSQNTQRPGGYFNTGGKIQRFVDGGAAKVIAGTGIYDSDKISGSAKQAILGAILDSGKPYDVLHGPAGAGKTTRAQQMYGDNFILSVDDISKYAEFLVLSGAGITKSGDFSPALMSILGGARKITALDPDMKRLASQRQTRIQDAILGNIQDTRSLSQLQATSKAPGSVASEVMKRFGEKTELLQTYEGGSPGGVRVASGKGRGVKGAKGARSRIEPVSTETYLKWAKSIYDEYDTDASLVMVKGIGGERLPPEIALANQLLTEYALQTGGAGLALGKKFVRTPKSKIVDELKPYLVQDPSDPNELGFYEDVIGKFGRSKKLSVAATNKLGKQSALGAAEARLASYTSAENAIAEFKKTGSLSLDPIIMDYIKKSIANPDSLPLDSDDIDSIKKKLTKPNLAAFSDLVGPNSIPVSVQGQRTKLSEVLNTILETYGSETSDLEIDNIIKGMGSKIQKKNFGGIIQSFMAGSAGSQGVQPSIDPIAQNILEKLQDAGGSRRVRELLTLPTIEKAISRVQTSGKMPRASDVFDKRFLQSADARPFLSTLSSLADEAVELYSGTTAADFELTQEQIAAARDVAIAGFQSDMKDLGSYYRLRKGVPLHVHTGIIAPDKYPIIDRLLEKQHMAQVEAAQEFAPNEKITPLKKEDRQKFGEANLGGYNLEAILALLGSGNGKKTTQDAIDFADGLTPLAASVFGVPPNIPTQAKLTVSSSNVTKALDGLIKSFAFGGKAEGPSFDEVRQKIIDKYPEIDFRISKRKKAFGYMIQGGLSSSQRSQVNFASNLDDLSKVSDKMAQDILYNYGPKIDPSLLKKLQQKKSFAAGGLAEATGEMQGLMRGLYGNRSQPEEQTEKKQKNFGKIGLRNTGAEITATYFKNQEREGMVTAKKAGDNLYTIGLSKATGGYGPKLYDVVMEAATAAGGMLTSDRNQVSDAARAVWAYYFNNRSDVNKTPLDPSQWTKNSQYVDPKLYGKKETWPPATDPAWILQSGYTKSPSLINSPDIVNMNDPKYAQFIQQQQLGFLSRRSGGDIGKFANGGTVPAMVSKGEAFVPPNVAKKIGYGKLNKMNQADRNGMKGFSGGGISVFDGPGSGTSDSIGPIGLPVGSFIIREKATKALGLNKGGAVGYSGGGALGSNRIYNFVTGGDVEEYMAFQAEKAGKSLEEFRKAIIYSAQEIERTINRDLVAAQQQLRADLTELAVSSGIRAPRGSDERKATESQIATILRSTSVDKTLDFDQLSKAVATALANAGPTADLDAVLIDLRTKLPSAMADQLTSVLQGTLTDDQRREQALRKAAERAGVSGALVEQDLGGRYAGGGDRGFVKLVDKLGGPLKATTRALGTVALTSEALRKAYIDSGSKLDKQTNAILSGLEGLGKGAGVAAELNIGSNVNEFADLLDTIGSRSLSGFGNLLRGISGPLQGAIIGFATVSTALGAYYNALHQSNLEEALDNLSKASDRTATAFKNLEKNNTDANRSIARDAMMAASIDAQKLRETGKVDLGQQDESIFRTVAKYDPTGLISGIIESSMGIPQEKEARKAYLEYETRQVGQARTLGEGRLQRVKPEDITATGDAIRKFEQELSRLEIEKDLRKAKGQDTTVVDKQIEDERRRKAEALYKKSQTFATLTEQGVSEEEILRKIYVEAAPTAEARERRSAVFKEGGDKAEKDKAIQAAKELLAAEGENQNMQRLMSDAYKKVRLETENLIRTYDRASALLTRFGQSIEDIKNSASSTAASIRGNAEIGPVDRTNERILNNMGAYSLEEVQQAAMDTSNLAGGGKAGEELRNQIVSAKLINDKLPEILGRTESINTESAIGELKTAFEMAGVTLSDSVSQELRKSLEEQTGGRQGASFEEFTANSNIVQEVQKKAAAAVKISQEFQKQYNDALSVAVELTNEYGKALQEATEYQLKASDIRIRSELQLAEALGKSLSLSELDRPLTSRITTLSSGVIPGGSTDPQTIFAGMMAAVENRKQDEQNLKAAQQAFGADPSAANKQALEAQLTNMAKQNNAINNSRKALEELANDTTAASEALKGLQEQQKIASGSVNFMQKILTSDADQLQEINKGLEAYTKVISGRASEQDMNSLDFRKNAFAGLENISSMMPESLRGQMQARVTRQMLESTAAGRNLLGTQTGGLYRGADGQMKKMTYGEALRMAETGEDPKQKEFIDAYRAANERQAQAADMLANAATAVSVSFEQKMSDTLDLLALNLPTILSDAVKTGLEQLPQSKDATNEQRKAAYDSVDAAMMAMQQLNAQQAQKMGIKPAQFDALSVSFDNIAKAQKATQTLTEDAAKRAGYTSAADFKARGKDEYTTFTQTSAYKQAIEKEQRAEQAFKTSAAKANLAPDQAKQDIAQYRESDAYKTAKENVEVQKQTYENLLTMPSDEYAVPQTLAQEATLGPSAAGVGATADKQATTESAAGSVAGRNLALSGAGATVGAILTKYLFRGRTPIPAGSPAGVPGAPTPPPVPGAPTPPRVPGAPTPPPVPGAPTPPRVPGAPTPPRVPGAPTPPRVPGAPTPPRVPGAPRAEVKPRVRARGRGRNILGLLSTIAIPALASFLTGSEAQGSTTETEQENDINNIIPMPKPPIASIQKPESRTADYKKIAEDAALQNIPVYSTYRNIRLAADYTGITDPKAKESRSEALDSIQSLMSLAGLVPGFGEPVDLINAAIYAARAGLSNDTDTRNDLLLDGTLSAGSAIPIGGYAANAINFGRKGVKTTSKYMAGTAAEYGKDALLQEGMERYITQKAVYDEATGTVSYVNREQDDAFRGLSLDEQTSARQEAAVRAQLNKAQQLKATGGSVSDYARSLGISETQFQGQTLDSIIANRQSELQSLEKSRIEKTTGGNWLPNSWTGANQRTPQYEAAVQQQMAQEQTMMEQNIKAQPTIASDMPVSQPTTEPQQAAQTNAIVSSNETQLSATDQLTQSFLTLNDAAMNLAIILSSMDPTNKIGNDPNSMLAGEVSLDTSSNIPVDMGNQFDNINDFAQAGLQMGSIYTHDVNSEKLLTQMLGLFSDGLLGNIGAGAAGIFKNATGQLQKMTFDQGIKLAKSSGLIDTKTLDPNIMGNISGLIDGVLGKPGSQEQILLNILKVLTEIKTIQADCCSGKAGAAAKPTPGMPPAPVDQAKIDAHKKALEARQALDDARKKVTIDKATGKISGEDTDVKAYQNALKASEAATQAYKDVVAGKKPVPAAQPQNALMSYIGQGINFVSSLFGGGDQPKPQISAQNTNLPQMTTPNEPPIAISDNNNNNNNNNKRNYYNKIMAGQNLNTYAQRAQSGTEQDKLIYEQKRQEYNQKYNTNNANAQVATIPGNRTVQPTSISIPQQPVPSPLPTINRPVAPATTPNAPPAAPQSSPTGMPSVIQLDSKAMEFVSKFGEFVTKLSEINIPSVIEVKGGNHTVDVRVSGAAAFEALQEGVKSLINDAIGEAMATINRQSLGVLGYPSSKNTKTKSGNQGANKTGNAGKGE